MIQAVTFDFWDTLYCEGDDQPQRHRQRQQYAHDFLLGEGRQVSPERLGYAFDILLRQLEHLRDNDHTGSAAVDIGQRLSTILGLSLDASQAARLGELISAAGREYPPRPIKGSKELLEALHGRVKTAVISDTGFTLGHDLYAVTEADGLAGLINHFTFSDQTGTTKPMVRQFHYTLYKLGCSARQAVHVGDLEHTDVAGAKEAGMRAIRILRPWGNPVTAADAVVAGIGQVLDVLREWELDV